MKIGDVVRPIPPMLLRCGCGSYDDAVVVSVDPFVLVSREGDMRWSATVAPHQFKTVATADADVQKVAMARWERDQRDPKI